MTQTAEIIDIGWDFSYLVGAQPLSFADFEYSEEVQEVVGSMFGDSLDGETGVDSRAEDLLSFFDDLGQEQSTSIAAFILSSAKQSRLQVFEAKRASA